MALHDGCAVLRRGGQLTPGKGGKLHNGQAGKRAADAIAETLAPTILDLQTNGLVSCGAIARELNQRGVPTAKGNEWRSMSVRRLLRRLEELRLAADAASGHQRQAKP